MSGECVDRREDQQSKKKRQQKSWGCGAAGRCVSCFRIHSIGETRIE